ncbi:hypothetical protein [uncultured Bilophila sp.]|uniref:hypothetical protein n=1 Tax=uncultured Bilophila sp. TaxID=529385 RepID=UPI00280A9745|nr:hypothetical protein [uncultured Bilophila sp.]
MDQTAHPLRRIAAPAFVYHIAIPAGYDLATHIDRFPFTTSSCHKERLLKSPVGSLLAYSGFAGNGLPFHIAHASRANNGYWDSYTGTYPLW